MRTILSLDGRAIGNLHIRIGSVAYKKSFEDAVRDGQLTAEEKASLDKLASGLRLPKELTDKISVETRTAYVNKFIAKILASQQFSPDEEAQLDSITASLEITPNLNEKTKQQLEKYKAYWAVKNLPLPIVQTDLTPQKGENCHFKVEGVKWYELRKVRVKSNSYDELTLIDHGTLYLTDKRMVFNGEKKTTDIQLSKILKITARPDGVLLEKDAGKDVTLRIPDRADIFHLMAQRLKNHLASGE